MTEARSQRLHVAATEALRRRQHAARDDLLSGFETRTDVLLWQHEVTACTLGRVDDDWHSSILSDRWLVSALLDDSVNRDAITEHAPGPEQVDTIRLDLYKDDLLPPCQSAIKWFWRKSTEYAGDDQPIDPTNQKFLAMRPRVQELATAQRRALHWAVNEPAPPGEPDIEHDGPIEDRQDLLEWVDEVVYATNGAVDEGFAARVCTPTSEWWRPLLVTRGAMLEILLAADVLPAMNRAIREAAKQAAEYPAEERERTTVPMG